MSAVWKEVLSDLVTGLSPRNSQIIDGAVYSKANKLANAEVVQRVGELVATVEATQAKPDREIAQEASALFCIADDRRISLQSQGLSKSGLHALKKMADRHGSVKLGGPSA